VRQAGFTLVEVMVALLILAVPVLAIQGLVGRAAAEMARARGIEEASTALAWVMDSLASVGYSGPGEHNFPYGDVTWRGEGAGEVASVTVILDGWGRGRDTVMVRLRRPPPPADIQ
jgi:prepilin-type N-terminal cleavage/methylation domain-containing protein